MEHQARSGYSVGAVIVNVTSPHGAEEESCLFNSVEEQSEAQGGEATSPRLHSKHVGNSDSDKPL